MRSGSTRIVSFLIIGLLMSAASASAADKWLSVRSRSFLLVGNASESAIKKVGRELEEFRTALGNVFPGVNQQSSIGTTVVVFKDDASFRPYKPLYQGKAGNVAGYFQAGDDVNFIALSADMQSPHVVYHEFVHSLTKDSTTPLPAWANEGLAEVYSMFELTGKEMTLGRAIAEHIATLNQGQMLPLNLLLSVEHGSPYYNERTKQGMFYAESWATVHYVMFANNGQRRAQFSKYLTLASNGKTQDENFKDAFQTDYRTLEEEIRRYVQNQVAWPAIRLKLDEKLDFDKEMRVSALTEAQGQYYLGDLLLHMNRLDVAETTLQKAVALDSKLPAGYASLGLLQIRQGKNDEALKFLTQAVDGDSQNYLAHYYYVQLLQQLGENAGAGERKSQWELMRTHIQKSIELAPRFTQAYSMLGYIALMSQEGLPAAEAAVKKGVEYAPGRLDLRFTLAQLMVANKETAPAQSLLTALKNSNAEDVIRYQAERLLASIKNEQEIEKDLRAYQQQQREAVVDKPAVADEPSDGPPVARRRGAPRDGGGMVETATPQIRVPEGTRVEGFLTMVECTNGLTVRIRVGNVPVELHTDTPSQVEFMSYVAAITDSIACGPVKPEVPVSIVYKRTGDPRFLGELLRVEFVNPK